MSDIYVPKLEIPARPFSSAESEETFARWCCASVVSRQYHVFTDPVTLSKAEIAADATVWNHNRDASYTCSDGVAAIRHEISNAPGTPNGYEGYLVLVGGKQIEPYNLGAIASSFVTNTNRRLDVLGMDFRLAPLG